MRYFNTTGPCDPAQHYMLPATARLPRARRLIEEGRYFVVHAPRQTGKTTTMTALARELTAAGERAALLVSIETAGPLHEDIEAVERAVLDSIRQAADRQLSPRLRPPSPWPDAATRNRIGQGLTDWAVACPLPLTLILDEIDGLQGAALVSALCQIRSGFSYKPQAFPDAVVLCGMRDVQDYRIAAGSGPVPSSPWSPFNIDTASQVTESPARFILPDGRLDFPALLDAFTGFWLENGEFMTATGTERANDYAAARLMSYLS